MNALRAIPAGILAGASAVLAGAAKLAELGARRLAPPTRPPAPSAPLERVEDAQTPGDVVRTTAEEAGEAMAGAGAAAGDAVQAAAEQTGDTLERMTDRTGDALADAGDTADDVLSDAGAAAPAAAPASTPPAPDDATGVAADLPPTDESVLDENGEARAYESHIAEIADNNVATVVREIQDLSTEELGQLFEYESAHRKRKTVLQAIERAAAPSDEETVYSTET